MKAADPKLRSRSACSGVCADRSISSGGQSLTTTGSPLRIARAAGLSTDSNGGYPRSWSARACFSGFPTTNATRSNNPSSRDTSTAQ